MKGLMKRSGSDWMVSRRDGDIFKAPGCGWIVSCRSNLLHLFLMGHGGGGRGEGGICYML